MKARTLLVVGLLAVAGCSKVNHQSSFTLEGGTSRTISISAPASEQKIKVVVTSEEPINVWVVLEKDIPNAAEDFAPESLKSGVVAKEMNTKSCSVNATIPAKEAYRVFFNGPIKKTNVTVKIDSQ